MNTEVINKLLEAVTTPQTIKKLFDIIEPYDYAFIGGFAVSFYTKASRKISPDDVDIAVKKTDIQKLKQTLIDNGFHFEKEHFFDGNYWIVFSDEHGQTIDIALADDPIIVKGINAAKIFDYKGTALKVIDKICLVANKIYAGRDKDKRDAIYLMKLFSNMELTELKLIIKKFIPDKMEDYDQLIEDMSYDNDFIDKLYSVV